MRVEALYEEGRQAWPELVVDREHYAAAAERLGARCGADLYLALACVAGNERAIEAVRDILVVELRYAAGKTTASADQLAEVAAHLSHLLFVDEPERPSAMRTYGARGDLASYVRVIARRELIRVVNRGRREVPLDQEIIDGLVPPSDPEISLLRARYRDDVDHVLREAIAALGERDRALLRYAFVDGLNVDSIGALYDVHRATAARWVAAARERIGETIRAGLQERLGVTPDEVDSIVRLVESRIDVSIERLLRE